MATKVNVDDRIRILEMKGEHAYSGKVGVIELVDSIKLIHGNETDRSLCEPTKAAREAMAAWQAKFIKIKKTKARKEAA